MNPKQIGDLPTRLSLLSRLKDWNDQENWQVFFDMYWQLIYSTAIKAGLNDAEAQDVVQETVISVMKNLRTFQYDPEKASFKGWLLTLTRWRIRDQFEKRDPHLAGPKARAETSTGTATVERVADPSGSALEMVWDEEWEANLRQRAIDKVKRKVDPKQYQIFDLHMFKKWPVAKVARFLGVSAGRVYLTKHRIAKLMKKEVADLRAKPMEFWSIKTGGAVFHDESEN